MCGVTIGPGPGHIRSRHCRQSKPNNTRLDLTRSESWITRTTLTILTDSAPARSRLNKAHSRTNACSTNEGERAVADLWQSFQWMDSPLHSHPINDSKQTLRVWMVYWSTWWSFGSGDAHGVPTTAEPNAVCWVDSDWADDAETHPCPQRRPRQRNEIGRT